MTNAKHAYIKFYGRDWLGDTMLRMCSSAERGVWIDLLCIMMSGNPYGHLAINGRAMTDEEAARIIGCSLDTYKGYLYRLEEVGITSRTHEGMLYSRRLVRDHNLFLSGSKFGKKGGGNPALNQKKSESRNQKPEAKGRLKVSYKGTFKGVNEAQVSEFEEFWEAYPRKTAKKSALKAWINPENAPPLDACLKTLAWQSVSEGWKKENGHFIPHPATWLNQQRWMDEPTSKVHVGLSVNGVPVRPAARQKSNDPEEGGE